MEKDEFYMRQALKQAEYAQKEDEVPVGAVIVYKSKIIAQSSNQVEKLKDSTAHAEMLALTQAASYLNSKWLTECDLYVTVEPCLMCAGALVLARINKVVFGVMEPKTGAFGSKLELNRLGLNHKLKVKKGVLEKESLLLLRDFFKKRRGLNKKFDFSSS